MANVIHRLSYEIERRVVKGALLLYVRGLFPSQTMKTMVYRARRHHLELITAPRSPKRSWETMPRKRPYPSSSPADNDFVSSQDRL